MSRTFKKLLLALNSRSMTEQGQALDDAITAWRGDLDQIDDICVIGVRVT